MTVLLLILIATVNLSHLQLTVVSFAPPSSSYYSGNLTIFCCINYFLWVAW